jgi:two-component system probable response regulator PhcQ
MEPADNNKKFAILYVDDEEKSLKYFVRAFGDDFHIFTAGNAQDGFKLLEAHADEIGLLLTDQQMPGEKGVWLLERARQLRPQILRMLVTAYADMDAAIAAVNAGAIHRYVTKPWDPPQLQLDLQQALEFFTVQTERDQLLAEKMSVLRNMMVADRIVSLGLLAAGLSHHIKNSLVAVKTFLELAPIKLAEEKTCPDSLRDPDFWLDYHQNVQGQIEKINSLLTDLRTALETDPGELFADEIHLKAVVAERLAAVQESFTARRLTVENQIPDTLPTLHVDRPKFDRLLDLLFRHELALLPAGSCLTLTAAAEGADLVLQLTDNGPALPPGTMSGIFDPFSTTNAGPSEYGINLMACFVIAHHHGGKIAAENRPGGGNLFTLRLPRQPGPAPAAPEETERLKKTLRNENLWGKILASR